MRQSKRILNVKALFEFSIKRIVAKYVMHIGQYTLKKKMCELTL